jgi:hypothetical protein
MGKIVFDLDDKLEEKLRLYINKNFPMKPYGQIKKVIEEALKQYLENK